AFMAVVALAAPLPLGAQASSRVGSGLASIAGPGEIEGVVVAAESGRPLAGAAVRIRPAGDSAVVASTLANARGRFHVDGLPIGAYLLRATSLGYAASKPLRVEVTGAAPRVQLGKLELAVAPVAVRPLEVVGRRDVVLAPDRTIYSTALLPAAAGGSAVDLLRQVPELEVAPDGTVSLRGSTSVAIQLNGRPAAMRGETLRNYLRQLPAEKIERVEVAPNPSARDDPEGMAGIVNLVLKASPELGASGSLSGYTGTRSAGSYAGLARQREALSLNGSVSLSELRNSTGNSDLRENLLARPLTFLEQTGSTANRGRSALLDLGAELRPAAGLSAWTTVTATAWRYDSDGRMAYAFRDSALLPLDRFDQVGSGGELRRAGDVLAGARLSLEPQRHELMIEARAAAGDDQVDAQYTRQALDAEGLPLTLGEQLLLNSMEGTDRLLSLQADYTRPLGPAGRLQAGTRVLDRRTQNETALTHFPPMGALGPMAAASTQPSGYLHREQFRSAYLTLRRSVRTLTLEGALRAEGASTHFRVGETGASYDHAGVDLFPSLSLSLGPASGRQLRLAYSRRVERPSAYLLNPDVPVTDSLNRRQGNPSLQPKYTHSVTADLTWNGRSGTVRLSPYYRRVLDNWDQVKRVDAQGAAVLAWENVASVTSYGAAASAWLPANSRLGGLASVGAYRELRNADNISPEYSGSALRLTASANGNFRATSSLTLLGSAFYSPARDLPQGRISSTLLTTLAAKRSLGQQLRAQLSVTDPFALWHYNFQTGDQTHLQTSRNSFSMRALTLYLSYSFGRAPQQAGARPSGEPPQPQADVRIH
ncbi:MAG TPA: TonB-dependent receptor, partial [Longimicrobiales bacterium]